MNRNERLAPVKTVDVTLVNGVRDRIPIDQILDVRAWDARTTVLVGHASIPFMGVLDDPDDLKTRIEQARLQ